MLLFNLVRGTRPATALELGSCLGLSAAYQAMAMQLNKCGRFVTLEGSPGFARIAAQTIATLELDNEAPPVTLKLLNKRLDGQATASVNNFSGRIDVIRAKMGDWAANFGNKYGPAITLFSPFCVAVLCSDILRFVEKFETKTSRT